MVNSSSRPLTLLAVDTSSPQGSIALMRQESSDSKPLLLGEKKWQKERSHSEVITNLTQELLAGQNLALTDLTVLSVGIGPGSFTGVRVALNFVKTLGYSLSIPIIPINSLLPLAEPHLISGKEPVLCLVNAYKNLIYCASFRKLSSGKIVTELQPQALSAQDLESKIPSSHICVGDGWPIFNDQFSQQFKTMQVLPELASIYPSATSLANLSLDPLFSTETKDWSMIKPLYIRASEAEERLKVGLLKPLPKI